MVRFKTRTPRLAFFSATLLLVAAGAVAFVACARDTTLAAPIRELRELDSPAAPASGEPNLLAGSDGKVYVSWIEASPDTTHALRFATLEGKQLSQPRTIASGKFWFVNWADFPAMIRLADGTLAAHWLQRSGPGRYSYDVKLTLSRDGGETWSEPITPHRDGTESEHGFASMFAAAADRLGIVWLDGRKYANAGQNKALEEMSLRYTAITSAGVASEDVAIDERTCDCCQTSSALTSKGPIVVYRDRSAEEVRDIHASRLVNGQWTPGRAVHNDGWKINFCPVNGPAISAREERVAVAWFTAADSIQRVLVAFSANAGETFGPPHRVDTGNPVGRVDVQLLRDNTALVSWLERADSGAEVRVRRVTPDGNVSEHATIASSNSERASGFPHMVVQDEHVVFAWTQPGTPARVRVAVAEVHR